MRERARHLWIEGGRAIYCLILPVAFACGQLDPSQELTVTLDLERQAHLEADAGLLASLVDDSLITVQAGRVSVLTRDQVEASFAAYFHEATYETWDDLEPPRVTLASDGSTAWVARRVHVGRTAQRFGMARMEAFVSSWVATYRWNGRRWLMTANSSGIADRAGEVLEGSMRALGNRTAVDAAQQINFRAAATGPGGAFDVEVRSTRDGRARITFGTGMSLGIEADRGWRTVEGTDRVEAITNEELEFVRGHELLMSVVAPLTRFPPLTYSGRTMYEGQPALRLSGVDALDGAVDAYYSTVDTLLVGFRVEDHLRDGGSVSIVLSAWRTVDGVRLPHRATFVQGPDTFEYVISGIDILSAPNEDEMTGPAFSGTPARDPAN